MLIRPQNRYETEDTTSRAIGITIDGTEAGVVAYADLTVTVTGWYSPATWNDPAEGEEWISRVELGDVEVDPDSPLGAVLADLATAPKGEPIRWIGEGDNRIAVAFKPPLLDAALLTRSTREAV